MAMTYRVVSQRLESRLTPGGNGFENVWVVTYQTQPENITGYIEVPERNYTLDFVQAELERVVSEVQKVHQL
jgi:Ni,Fe-hydrogenase III large subunit